ncbi:hypothetical protein [Roseibium alexandrii]|uniref:Uncharacterized protein n=1 Tax=Roseibium alexandrii (strain DSM 17067 / NCIMB 14079 / DFL-11) TaxID=244592 RepID=A0A5E8H4L3_ROSAD|nr:hypothetical protein [Roseibium alexandrii]EEE47625.1 hypothetical protein SADFL11_4914 [Roseibium alexandrii DFL-11]
MIEPRSTATIRALASLAELSADQLEEGTSVEDVIATLRKAAEAVRMVIDETETEDGAPEEADLAQDLTPMDLSGDDAAELSDDDSETKSGEIHVLNAG